MDSGEIIYLGVDPGLKTTGYGLIAYSGNSVRLVDGGTITSDVSSLLHERIHELYKGLNELLDEYKPDIMGIEEVFAHYKHPATAIKMAHVRGVLCLACMEQKIKLVSIPSTQIKKLVTGNGRASKEQVAGMVKHILGISEDIKPDDVTDALAAAIAAHESERNDRIYQRNN